MIPKLYDTELLDDLGLWRGWAVFEAMQARGTVIFHFQDHFKRLMRSCELSKISLPDFLFADTLRLQLESCIASHDFSESLVKVAVSRGKSKNHKDPDGEPSLFFRVLPLPKQKDKPLKLVVKKAIKSNFPEIKSVGPYHDAMLLRSMAQKEGFDDFLYYYPEIGISETSMANIFFVQDTPSGKVLSTPNSNILFGVTRSIVLSLTKKTDFFYTVLELPSFLFGKYLLQDVKECFITSTTLGVMEVESIQFVDGTVCGFELGKATERIKEEFLDYKKEYFQKHSA